MKNSEQLKANAEKAWRKSERYPKSKKLRQAAEQATKLQIAAEFQEQRDEIAALADVGLQP